MILLTGATGVVGSALLQRLLQEGKVQLFRQRDAVGYLPISINC